MKIKHAIRMLAWLTCTLACAAVWAGDMAPPAQDTANPVSGDVSQQIRKGVVEDVGYRPPFFDDIIKEGIRIPEEADGVAEVSGSMKEDGTQEKRNKEEIKP